MPLNFTDQLRDVIDDDNSLNMCAIISLWLYTSDLLPILSLIYTVSQKIAHFFGERYHVTFGLWNEPSVRLSVRLSVRPSVCDIVARYQDG